MRNEHGDRTRVLGQIVTRIGFLGAGVIIAREGLVKGVTSAAVIWVLAVIGALIGFAQYAPAIAFSLVTAGLLTGIACLEARFRQLRTGEREPADEPDGDGSSRTRR
jgi:putative Mg2+ transporter-C (MgtC) family protein